MGFFLRIIIIFFPIFALGNEVPKEIIKEWHPQSSHYFLDVLKDVLGENVSSLEIKRMSLSYENFSPEEKELFSEIYQFAASKNIATTPAELYQLKYQLDGEAYSCTAALVKETDFLNSKVSDKKILERARYVLIDACEGQTKKKQTQAIARYAILPKILPIGTIGAFERYRATKQINPMDKTFVCMSKDTSPLTQGPRHAFVIYNTPGAYIWAWQSATSSSDPDNPEYPVKIDSLHDVESIKEAVASVEYFQALNGRGQIVFKKENCQIKALEKRELFYAYCRVEGTDAFHPGMNTIMAEIAMKKVTDSRYATDLLALDPVGTQYTATEVNISFEYKTESSLKRYSTGYDFTNLGESKECLFQKTE